MHPDSLRLDIDGVVVSAVRAVVLPQSCCGCTHESLEQMMMMMMAQIAVPVWIPARGSFRAEWAVPRKQELRGLWLGRGRLDGFSRSTT